jgi:hypothetical protein
MSRRPSAVNDQSLEFEELGRRVERLVGEGELSSVLAPDRDRMLQSVTWHEQPDGTGAVQESVSGLFDSP